MKCPKCEYQRKSTDLSPDWQCPSCGVAYSKVNQQQSSRVPETKSQSPLLEFERSEFETAPASTVRLWGAIKLVLGSVLAYGSAVLLWKYFTGRGALLIPFFIALIALGGMVEVITGISVIRIVKSWNEFEKTKTAKTIKYAIWVPCMLFLLYLARQVE